MTKSSIIIHSPYYRWKGSHMIDEEIFQREMKLVDELIYMFFIEGSIWLRWKIMPMMLF